MGKGKIWSLGFGAAGMLILGGASAQPGVEFAYPLAVGVLPQVPLEVSSSRDVALSPEQMMSEVNSYFPQMEQGASSVRRQLSTAREQRDVVKVLCLNDKLTQINVAVRSAQDRGVSLRASVTRSDKDRSRHEFTVLRVLRDRVRTLVSESNQCIGEEVGFIGDSKVTATIDPNIPAIDPTDLPGGIGTIISIPPVISSPIQ